MSEGSDVASSIAEEAAALPSEKQHAVLDYVRSLQRAESEGDAAWERIIGAPGPGAELEKFLQEAAAEGEEPLDLNRL